MDLVKREEDEDQQAFLPKARESEEISLSEVSFSEEEEGPRKTTPWASKKYLRLILEIVMALVILVLFIHPFPATRLGKPTPVPEFPLKTYTFVENPKYLNEGMFASKHETLITLHNWIELSSVGRGLIKVDNPEYYGLDPPYNAETNTTSGPFAKDGPVYMISAFHQLHCLSYLVQSFQIAIEGTDLTQEIVHHSTHCYDYLRQSIMCAADTTLEGKSEVGPGWGSKHECKDYDAVVAWADEMTVFPWRGNLPDEATL